MTTFLIIARTAPSAGPEGEMVLYTAAGDDETGALDAVRKELPYGWRIEKVIGAASDDLAELLKLAPGAVRRLS